MELSLSTSICEIINTSIYSRLMSQTKKEYQFKLTALFQKEVSKIITDAMKEVFHRRIKCNNVMMQSPEYHDYGFESIRWEINLSEEEIQDIVAEYIINHLGESRLAEIQLELSDDLYVTIEENHWQQ